MFDSLEPRRLYAASAVLKNGVLGVVGTNESEHISVNLKNVGGATTGNSIAPRWVYAVNVDNSEIATFEAADVTRINVFALGGNDSVNVRKTLTAWEDVSTAGQSSLSMNAQPPTAAPFYIEGGSGNDRLIGGAGNDTIKGGRGDDIIGDAVGRNYLDGGQGDDQIHALISVRSNVVGEPSFSTVGSGKNRILGGPGQDTVGYTNSDTLIDTPEDTLGYVLGATSIIPWGEG